MTDDPRTDDTLLVHAYVDGELDPAHALEIERRIAADPALGAERASAEALRNALREKVPAKPLPAHVRARVVTAVGLDRARTRPTWMALAASVALALMVGSSATYLAQRPFGADPVATAVVDGHMRALMAATPIDVASSDRHTVKPWFNGRIPQAPRVADLSADGFTLTGGRIDVIAGAPVPTLVYRYREHVISLTEIAATGAAPSAPHAIKGYNLVRWTDDGTAYWAISDLGAGELEAFARLFAPRPPTASS